ncbi:hypothetical protein ACYUJ6_02125 [Clostridium sp. JNZ X4-2]
MSMFLRTKINSIKSELKKRVQDENNFKAIVKAREGLFLFDLNKGLNVEGKCIPIEKGIQGIEINDCSDHPIGNIVATYDDTNNQIDVKVVPEDIPYSKRIAAGYLNNPQRPFESFTDSELEKIIEYVEKE